MDTDKILGQHLNISVENESGMEGVRNDGAAGVVQKINNVAPNPDGQHRNPVHVDQVTLNAIQFTTALPIRTPQLSVRIDDGDYYYDSQRGRVNGLSGSTFVATDVSLPGIASINLGDHFQMIQIGQIGTVTNGVPGTTTAGQMVAGQLLLFAGNDLDTVIVAANVKGQLSVGSTMPTAPFLPAIERIALGDNTINPVQGIAFPAVGTDDQLPPPSVFTSGQVGTAAISGDMTLAIGNNLSIPGNGNGNNNGEPLGWPVKMSNNVLGSLQLGTGNLTIFPSTLPKLETGTGGGAGQRVVSPAGANNGLAMLLSKMSVQSDVTMTLGSGGFSHRESLVLLGVLAGNIAVGLTSDGTEVPKGNPNQGVYVVLDDVQLTDTIFGDSIAGTSPGFTLRDFGAGEDFVWLGLLPVGLSGLGFQNGMGPAASDLFNVQGEASILLSHSGGNRLESHNTTAGAGMIDGGGGRSIYIDDGGNGDGFGDGFSLRDFYFQLHRDPSLSLTLESPASRPHP